MSMMPCTPISVAAPVARLTRYRAFNGRPSTTYNVESAAFHAQSPNAYWTPSNPMSVTASVLASTRWRRLVFWLIVTSVPTPHVTRTLVTLLAITVPVPPDTQHD